MKRIVPLGDQAALVYFEKEPLALEFASLVRSAAFSWVLDVVQAYSSVAIFFNPDRIWFRDAVHQLKTIPVPRKRKGSKGSGKLHLIPCCYGLQLDLERISQHTHLSGEEIISLHTQQEYVVYAIGFCPGFPYLGYLPPPLCGVPRLETPRLRLEEGCVGLTGRQTGIYTQVRPGGWNILGRTPLQLVNVADEYFPLRTGDRVRFQSIDEKEFHRLSGQRL